MAVSIVATQRQAQRRARRLSKNYILGPFWLTTDLVAVAVLCVFLGIVIGLLLAVVFA